ncbi:sensor histidine kinase [Kitasatospora phosalacinea]|uniref:sensor histidine kinase n=1 Tax=Kitasatospora phosalacinea TaxID=2065 RepID=UPI0036654FFC
MRLVGRLTGWFRGRSLRSRLAVLTAAAVAVAIAVVAVACWLIVRNTLYGQVQQSLKDADPPGAPNQSRVLCDTSAAAALAKAATAPEGRLPFHQNKYDNQFVIADGTVCFPPQSNKIIQHTDADLTASTGKPVYRKGSYADGSPAMVRIWGGATTIDGQSAVLLTALPTQDVEDSLRSLALLMASVAGLGVIGAGVTGRIVARSALKPVDQLTDAVEHIARTEEVGTTIPVNGQDEIARLSTSFNSMSTALANSRERQTRLIADAGHELRTPLTSLRTNVDLLIRSDAQGRALPPETRARMLGNMKAQMQELTLLIGDLLQLSRPDTPNPEAVRAVVPFHETVGRALERGRLRGPSLVFDTDVRPWYVHGDPAALERAVINLLDNAVKYSPPAGTIDVRLQGGRLTVRDRGPGIPAEELPYVFDRFWRSPSSRQLPGSGLGLSIVAQTVQDTGGQVSLGPAPDGGAGTQAVVVLPGQPEEPR